MTIKEAILKSLEDLKKVTHSRELYNHIISNGYYEFKEAKTPVSTVSALLGDFIRHGDTRVKRIKGEGGTYSYYLTKFEELIDFDTITTKEKKEKTLPIATYKERDLHTLLSSYLKNTGIFSKTIFHEKSKNSADSHQKWIHPDMVGVKFLNLQNKVSQTFLKTVNRSDIFKLSSYEIKKEISSDYELKKYFFQAVSNSSWANFGYLVAFEISNNLNEEMERLNQSFGIGIIELSANPFFSKVLYPAKHREIDFKTVDKLCKINKDFELFIKQIGKLLNAQEDYISSTEKELEGFCDSCLNNDSEVAKYCKDKNIPVQEEVEENNI